MQYCLAIKSFFLENSIALYSFVLGISLTSYFFETPNPPGDIKDIALKIGIEFLTFCFFIKDFIFVNNFFLVIIPSFCTTVTIGDNIKIIPKFVFFFILFCISFTELRIFCPKFKLFFVKHLDIIKPDLKKSFVFIPCPFEYLWTLPGFSESISLSQTNFICFFNKFLIL